MTFKTLMSASALAIGAAFLTFPTCGIAGDMTGAPLVLAAATTAAPSGHEPMPRKMGFRQRVHECKAQWKADKAAGKISDRETWRDYWKDCNIRLNPHQ
ncbi:hypothetical protein [Mesorhizobium sp. KR1-2]|uniref:hypothetical protein n=1 Tax=Mesorhizobium sp. KR1-2 TaxID=3156609 RepID=UPI0032B3EABA